MKKWILVILLVLLVSLAVGYARYRNWLVLPLIVSEAELPTLEANEAKIGQNSEETAIVVYLDRLAKAENCPLEGIIDVNGLSSRGPFCFQKSTYLYFVKRYEIYPHAEEGELLSNWGDRWTQEEIVRKIIEEDKRLLAIHWKISVSKLGLPR